MTVTNVRLMSVEGGIGRGAERTFTTVYQVQTDDKNDGPITARDAAGVPAWLSTFTYGNDADVGAVLYDKRAKLMNAEESYKFWDVTCRYGTGSIADTGRESDQFVDNPIDLATRWSGTYIQMQRPYDQDNSDNAIKNSAGDPFVDPPAVGDDSRMGITVLKNFSALNLSLWSTYPDAVNNAVWWGLGVRTIKVQRIAWTEEFYEGVPYYPVTFEFHIKFDTWDFELLNAGYRQKTAGGKAERILDERGLPVSHPWPLTAGGAALTQAQIDSDSETYETFRVYSELDFSLLGLPATLGAA